MNALRVERDTLQRMEIVTSVDSALCTAGMDCTATSRKKLGEGGHADQPAGSGELSRLLAAAYQHTLLPGAERECSTVSTNARRTRSPLRTDAAGRAARSSRRRFRSGTSRRLPCRCPATLAVLCTLVHLLA
jgi:hypothetical protein